MLDIPDALLLLEETEGALDPLFGVLQDVWLSPGFFAKVAGRETRDREPGEGNQTRKTDENQLCVSEG